MEERIPDRVSGLIDLQKAADGARDGHQCRSEDDGHDAAHVQLQGQVAVLAAHLLPTHHTLGVLDGDAALCVGHDHHKDHSDQCQNYQNRQQDIELRLAGRCAGQQTRHRGVQRGPVGNDGGEDQKGNTVADTLVIDLLARPGDQLSTCNEGSDDDHSGEHADCAGNILQCTHVADHEVVANAHDQCDHGTGVPVDLLQLLLAVRFLCQIFQRGNGHSQQLHNNRGVDIGCHT